MNQPTDLVVKLSREGVEVVEGSKGGGNRKRLDRQGSNVLHGGHQLVGEVGLDAVDASHTETIVDAVDQTQTIVKAIDKASVLDQAVVKAIEEASVLDQAIVEAIEEPSVLHKTIAVEEAISTKNDIAFAKSTVNKSIANKHSHGAGAADDSHQRDDDELHGCGLSEEMELVY